MTTTCIFQLSVIFFTSLVYNNIDLNSKSTLDIGNCKNFIPSTPEEAGLCLFSLTQHYNFCISSCFSLLTFTPPLVIRYLMLKLVFFLFPLCFAAHRVFSKSAWRKTRDCSKDKEEEEGMNFPEWVWGLSSVCMCYCKTQNWDNPVTMRSNVVVMLQPLLDKNRNSSFCDFTQNTHSQPEL